MPLKFHRIFENFQLCFCFANSHSCVFLDRYAMCFSCEEANTSWNKEFWQVPALPCDLTSSRIHVAISNFLARFLELSWLCAPRYVFDVLCSLREDLSLRCVRRKDVTHAVEIS